MRTGPSLQRKPLGMKFWGETPEVKIRGDHVVMADTVCQLFVRWDVSDIFLLRAANSESQFLSGEKCLTYLVKNNL